MHLRMFWLELGGGRQGAGAIQISSESIDSGLNLLADFPGPGCIGGVWIGDRDARRISKQTQEGRSRQNLREFTFQKVEVLKIHGDHKISVQQLGARDASGAMT